MHVPASRVRIRNPELVRWLEQLATLLGAGLSLPQALDAMQSAESGKGTLTMMRSLEQSLALGEPFSMALAAFPATFDAFALALIHTGEQTGQLELALRRLAATIDARVRLQRQLLQILAYPAVVMVVSLGISLFLLWSVIPQFASLFQESGAELPWLTSKLLSISDTLRERGPLQVLAAVIGVTLISIRILRSRRGKRWCTRLPLVAPLWLQIASARWAATLSLTTRVGLPFLEALQLASATAGHPRYLLLCPQWIERVRAGDPLIQALHDAPLPAWALQMIGIGQDAGSLDPMLDRVAAILNDAAERRIKVLQTLLEPVVMVILGALVGTLLLAMYLPIFKMASAVGA